jgi:hypothetical protein
MLPPILRAGHVVRRALVTATVTAMTAAALLPMASAQAAAQKTIYVSPNGTGNCSSASNPCSLTQAQSAVRADNKNMSGDIDVILADGVYHRSSTLTFTGADSGTNGHTVRWQAAPGAHPVISGGAKVTGWTRDDAGKNIWKAKLPDGVSTRQLYVNGTRATLAKQDAPSDLSEPTDTGYTVPGNALQKLSNPSNLELAYKPNTWIFGICGVSAISGDSTSTKITMKQPCFKTARSIHSGTYTKPVWLQNAKEFLTSPGTFAYDNTKHEIYYIPRSGENLATADTQVGNLETLLALIGTDSAPVRNIAFSGVGFQYSTWLQPGQDKGLIDQQATMHLTDPEAADAWSWKHFVKPDYGTTWNNTPYGSQAVKPPAAVEVRTGRNITISDGAFSHLGSAGLNLSDGTQDSTALGNRFTDVSGTAVLVGDVKSPKEKDVNRIDSGITVKNNYIRDAGREFLSGVGIFGGYVKNTTITHNDIIDSNYSAISLGWGWGSLDTVPSVNSGNHITDNYINTTKLDRYDGGAIYTLGDQPGGVISGNYIVNDQKHGGAIYPDQGSTNWTINKNVVKDSEKWLNVWSNGFQDLSTITVADNYTNNGNQSAETNSTTGEPKISGTVIFKGNDLPAPAQEIAGKAGLEPAYQDLRYEVRGQIVGAAGNRCVDVPYADSTDGKQLQLYDCNNTKAQAWAFPGDGTIRALGKCMDVRASGTADGTVVQLYRCNGTPAQQWTYDRTTKRYRALGKCLDASYPGTGNGTKLQIWGCWNGTNQQWSHP